jgi:hypothetical protein
MTMPMLILGGGGVHQAVAAAEAGAAPAVAVVLPGVDPEVPMEIAALMMELSPAQGMSRARTYYTQHHASEQAFWGGGDGGGGSGRGRV